MLAFSQEHYIICSLSPSKNIEQIVLIVLIIHHVKMLNRILEFRFLFFLKLVNQSSLFPDHNTTPSVFIKTEHSHCQNLVNFLELLWFRIQGIFWQFSSFRRWDYMCIGTKFTYFAKFYPCRPLSSIMKKAKQGETKEMFR